MSSALLVQAPLVARRYLREDYSEIASWYRGRGLAVPSPEMLPYEGRIVHGIAAGWLYRTDSSFCLLDGFIANHDAAQADRSEALELIASGLIEEARRQGLSHVVAYTQIHTIARLAERLGFQRRGARMAFDRGL